MKERLKDKMRLEHILEAIDRLQNHASSLSREELESDVLRYYGIVKNIEITGQEKLPRTVEAHQYDNLYAQAQKTIAKQAQEIERLKNRVASKKSNNDRLNQERVAKLKNRIYSLENLIQRYKEQGYEVIKGFE